MREWDGALVCSLTRSRVAALLLCLGCNSFWRMLGIAQQRPWGKSTTASLSAPPKPVRLTPASLCAVRECLGCVVGCLAEALGRTPNEAAIFRDYGRAVLALDEVICEVRESGLETAEPLPIHCPGVLPLQPFSGTTGMRHPKGNCHLTVLITTIAGNEHEFQPDLFDNRQDAMDCAWTQQMVASASGAEDIVMLLQGILDNTDPKAVRQNVQVCGAERIRNETHCTHLQYGQFTSFKLMMTQELLRKNDVFLLWSHRSELSRSR